MGAALTGSAHVFLPRKRAAAPIRTPPTPNASCTKSSLIFVHLFAPYWRILKPSKGNTTGRKAGKDEKMKNYTFALYTEPTRENDLADWYDDISSAMDAAREAIAEGVSSEDVTIMKFAVGCDECGWDAYITFDDQGRAWSESWAAREDMGTIQ